MADLISVHSFRGGTGKSNTTANVAALLARDGKRVAVVDLDIQSPGIHVLFGMEQESGMVHSLNDYLWGNCQLRDAAHDVTSSLDDGLAGNGKRGLRGGLLAHCGSNFPIFRDEMRFGMCRKIGS